MRAAILVAAALSLAASSAIANPIGLWRAKDGAQIRIGKCGAALCGHVAVARIDPATGKPARAKHDGRPLTGLQIMIGMRADGPGKWSGRLYNEDDGRLYDGHLIELGPRQLRIEGCALGICGGDRLTRIR